MKKLLLTAAIVAFLGFTATAQEQGEIRVGAGLAYGTQATIDLNDGSEKGALGLNFGGEYFITDVISAAPSYTMFFKEEEGGSSFKTSSFNLDARYYFGEGTFYGLAGLGFSSAKAEGGGFSATSSDTGINLGVGAMIPAGDALFINGQAKYNTSFEQFVLQAGVAFAF